MSDMAKVKVGETVSGDVKLDSPNDVKLEGEAAPVDVPTDTPKAEPPVVTAEDVAQKPPEVVPPPPATNEKKIFTVSLGDKSGRYSARDKEEAWALFCDHHKTYPSPKHPDKRVEEVG